MTKWALTADLQLNTQPRYSTLVQSGITSRLQDSVDCLAWIADKAMALDCDHLLVLGDIFDSRTTIDVSVLDRACREFAAIGEHIDTHVLVGNHDCYLRTPALNSLQALRGVTVHEKPTQVGQFYLVPWTDDPDDLHAMLKKAGKSDALYLATHAMFEGAVPMAKGLPLAWLKEAEWHGVFMGDVHDPVVLQEEPLIRYVGAPLQIHFGDAGGTRGFVFLDETGEAELIENEKSPRFHLVTSHDDFPKKPATDRDFFRVRCDDHDLAQDLVQRARKLSSWVECESMPEETIKVRLDVKASMDDEDLLRAYAKHHGVEGEQLIEAGLNILSEARSL